MSNTIQESKTDVYTNHHFNLPSFLFIFSEPLAFVGIYIAYLHAKECLANPYLFDSNNMYMALYLGIAYLLRIPYMWDKLLARIFLVLNAAAWAYVTYLYHNADILKKTLIKKPTS